MSNGAISAAAKQLARLLLTAQEHGDPALTSFRVNACQACADFNAGTRRCRVCGCYVDLKARMGSNRTRQGVQITHCPKGRWDDLHLAEHYGSGAH